MGARPRDADRVFDNILQHEIRKLNQHLPRTRRPISELLNEEIPAVPTHGGDTIILKREEVQRLAAEVPKEFHGRIRLPFVLLRRMDLGQGVFTVTGEQVEEFTVKKILGLTDLDYSLHALDKQSLHLFRPQVSELMRKYHSLIIISFGTPAEFQT
jgi:hypothetical protein